MRIAGEERRRGPTGTGTPDSPEPQAGAVTGPLARRRRRRAWLILSLAGAILLGAGGYTAYEVASHRDANAIPGAALRPSGIPGNISTGLANLMSLSPVPGVRAPGFTLTDQHGRTMSLASLRGKVVVLEFMDPHCTDICPIVSQEFVDAYHRLGALAGRVVFAAINVNAYHASVADMAGYSAAHQLTTIPGWHFLTGPVPALRAAWHAYNIEVVAPSPNADIVHTSAVYFIDAAGKERFLASPMVDHTSGGTAYLPLAQVSAWGGGIARIAADLAR